VFVKTLRFSAIAMSKFRQLIFYVLTIGLFGGLVWWILYKGTALEVPGEMAIQAGNTSSTPRFLSFHNPLAILVLQIVTIIITARIFSYVFSKIRQPLVIGEIIAGIFLGPSLLGMYFPEISGFIFPEEFRGNLEILSQIGLIFFMFIIGMELDVKLLKNKANAAVVISHASITFPYFLGVLLAYGLYENFAPPGISFLAFALFMGIATSITAFPVLARIIQERGLTQTPLGVMAITCAATDDVTAWCILAAVIAIVKAGSIAGALYVLAMAAVYVLFMLKVVQPLMNKIGNAYASKEIVNKKIIGVIFLVLLGSAYLSEIIGIHALFGAFLAGVIMPQNLSFKKIITDKIEDVSLVLLLPLFFVFTGLRTEIGLLNSADLWMTCGLVIGVAILGKFGGSAIAAKFVGHSTKDSLSLGVLMNTRGLMELVVLNIGLDLGILSREIFAMMVIMALCTTFLTGPGLDIIERVFRKKNYGEEILSRIKTSFKILVSFGPPRMGDTLVRLADQLTKKNNSHVEVTALHITPSSEINPYDAYLFEQEGFQPIRSASETLGISLQTIYKNTEEVDKEMVDTVHQSNYDLVLVGAARPVFNDRATGGKLKLLLDEANTNVGVLIDRKFTTIKNVLLLLGSVNDLSLLQYADRFRASNNARVTILKMLEGQFVNLKNPESPYYLAASSFKEVIEHRIPDKELLAHYELVLVSLEFWDKINLRSPWIKDCPSILVVKHFQDLTTDNNSDNLVPEKTKQE
jgi:Kef-type K+ transport system membrane component KefB